MAQPPVRATNLTLLVALVVVFLTGLGAITAGEADDRWVVIGHGVAGLSILVLSPWKTRVAARGLRRKRSDRAMSLALAVIVLLTVALGLLHTTGLLSREDVPLGNEVLWWHVAGALVAIPLILWHVVARRTLPRTTDLRRRSVLRLGAVAAVAGAAWLGAEGVLRLARAPGASRRFTGSIEVASFDPAGMPRVIWLDDRTPDVEPDTWRVAVTGVDGGRALSLAALRAMPGSTRRVALDCTGGWYSVQDWDGVPLADLIDTTGARSILVRSRTGYAIRFAVDDIDDLLLAYGYNGEALRRGHGGPVRLVAVGSRGYRWVKWVDRIEVSDLPARAEPVLPLT